MEVPESLTLTWHPGQNRNKPTTVKLSYKAIRHIGALEAAFAGDLTIDMRDPVISIGIDISEAGIRQFSSAMDEISELPAPVYTGISRRRTLHEEPRDFITPKSQVLRCLVEMSLEEICEVVKVADPTDIVVLYEDGLHQIASILNGKDADTIRRALGDPDRPLSPDQRRALTDELVMYGWVLGQGFELKRHDRPDRMVEQHIETRGYIDVVDTRIYTFPGPGLESAGGGQACAGPAVLYHLQLSPCAAGVYRHDMQPLLYACTASRKVATENLVFAVSSEVNFQLIEMYRDYLSTRPQPFPVFDGAIREIIIDHGITATSQQTPNSFGGMISHVFGKSIRRVHLVAYNPDVLCGTRVKSGLGYSWYKILQNSDLWSPAAAHLARPCYLASTLEVFFLDHTELYRDQDRAVGASSTDILTLPESCVRIFRRRFPGMETHRARYFGEMVRYDRTGKLYVNKALETLLRTTHEWPSFETCHLSDRLLRRIRKHLPNVESCGVLVDAYD